MFARITLTIVDGDGDTAPVSVLVSVAGSTTLSDLVESYAHLFSDVVANIIWGHTSEVKITIEPDINTWFGFDVVADVLSDVEEKALFEFGTPMGTSFEMTIPTIYEGRFENSGAGKNIDLTNSDIQTFIVLMTEDIANGGIDAVDSHGFDISRFRKGVQAFRPRKRK